MLSFISKSRYSSEIFSATKINININRNLSNMSFNQKLAKSGLQTKFHLLSIFENKVL